LNAFYCSSGKRLHGGVVADRDNPTHRTDNPVARERADELLEAELGEFDWSMQHRVVESTRRTRPISRSRKSLHTLTRHRFVSSIPDRDRARPPPTTPSTARPIGPIGLDTITTTPANQGA
jgi:hypothetical protein